VLPTLLSEAKIASSAAIPFHSLRAVGTSLLASKGVSESTLARRLGHGKRTVTARYTTTYDPDLQAAAALMGRLLSPVLKGRSWAKSGAKSASKSRTAA
jgi:integrase